MTRPKLPSADALLPYLRRIDENRMYCNFGPLNAEYEARLADLFKVPVVTASSATSALTATLMAYDLPKGAFVAMPSWTFPATAAAVVNAGLMPHFVDVDEKTCALNPWERRGVYWAAIAVAPFGSPVNVERWEYFAKVFRIPVIIDAAAGFDALSTSCKPGNCPVIVSTHATKAFGTGEGGFVACADTDLLEKIRRITNFGLSPDRRVEYNGLNAKFSEYHAAVGLASLDWWPQKRKLLLDAVKPYGLDYAVTQIPVRGGDGKKGVYGCHIHGAYRDCPRTLLPVTEELIENIRCVTVGIE